MGKRGAKRRFNNKIPAHIDQNKLPDRCYWDNNGNGHWYTKFFDENGKQRRKRIAGRDALLSELYSIIESWDGDDHGTFRWIANKYFESSAFKALVKSTRADYQYSFDVVASFDTKINIKLADVPLKNWDTPLIQKFVDLISEHPTKAKHVHGFIRRVFSWSKPRGYVTNNPAIGVQLPKQRRLQRLPSKRAYNALVNYAKQHGTHGQKISGSCPHYIWPVMELEYLCRLRGVEARSLTDANLVDQGLLVFRRKGSKANITEFNDRLSKAINYLQSAREEIWQERKFPIPLKPEQRFLIVNTLGENLKKSAYQSAWNRFIRGAIDREIIKPEERFSLHDLKRKGVTDTEGTEAEKMQASGHRDPRMMDVYDKSIAIVKPTSE